MKLLLINGPPGVGKDTLASAVVSACHKGVSKTSVSTRLKIAARGMLPETKQFSIEELDQQKDKPLFGPRKTVTWRQILIRLSEQVFKPLFGDDYFGRVVADEISKLGLNMMPRLVIQCGFNEEALPLVELVGRDNCRAVRLRRLGHAGWEHDSRQWLDDKKLGIKVDWCEITGPDWVQRTDIVAAQLADWLQSE